MNIKTILNGSDAKVDSMVKLEGTNYDRRRKVTKSMKHRMEQMHNSGKSYHAIAKHFDVSVKAVRYNLDEAFRQWDINSRVNRAKKTPPKRKVDKREDRIAYKKELLLNKNIRRSVVSV